MATSSSIEWCDSTFNPWIGCTKVSPARTRGIEWGAGKSRVRTSESNWNLPRKWNQMDVRIVNGEPMRYRGCTRICGIARPTAVHVSCVHAKIKGGTTIGIDPDVWEAAKIWRRRVFCASLADVFDNEVEQRWRDDLFALIYATPNLDWLLLTKRIGNAGQMVHDSISNVPESHGNRWDNVWLGATICNQAEADRDIPKLLSIPAAKRFVSIEPMLGAINFRWQDYAHRATGETYREYLERTGKVNQFESLKGIDWVIAGGESGPNARPMHPDWIRSLRDQCAAAQVPFLFKQWGEWTPHRCYAGFDEGAALRSGRVRYLQGDGREPDGHFRRGDAAVIRVGKKAAGRTLDGVTHHAFPA